MHKTRLVRLNVLIFIAALAVAFAGNRLRPKDSRSFEGVSDFLEAWVAGWFGLWLLIGLASVTIWRLHDLLIGIKHKPPEFEELLFHIVVTTLITALGILIAIR